MGIYIRGERDGLDRAALAVAQETGIWFLGVWQNAEVPGTTMFELTCAEGSLEIYDGELRTICTRLFR